MNEMEREKSSGTLSIEEKKTDEAESQELEKKKREAQNLAALGNQLQNQKRFAEAFEFYSRSRLAFAKIGDRAGIASQLKNMAYIKEIMGEFALSVTFYQESKTLLREIDDKEEFSEVADRIAKTLYKEGKFEEAIKEYQEAIDLGCQGGDLFNNIGFIYITTHKVKEAQPYLEKSREIRASESNEYLDITLNNLGIVAFIEKDFDRAISYFKEALEANKRKLKEDRTISFIVFAQDKETEEENLPLECYNDVCTRASENLNLAAAHALKGEKDKALKCCQEAHALDPEGGYLTLPTAWIYYSLGEKERALSYFKRVLSIHPTFEHIKKIVDRINPFAFEKAGRNESCPCGSGKKFKKCHGKNL
jgi:tetratricopeptide (TPR) repeat protein